MTAVTQFAKHVTNYCPSLPTFVFAQAFGVASREYFKKTQAWRETLIVDVPAGATEVELYEWTTDSDIDAIDEVRLGQAPLAYLQSKPTHTSEGRPCYFYTQGKRSITLHPTPKEDQTLSVDLRLVPKVRAEDFPESVFNDNYEGLVAGTVANLKRMSGTQWHDPSGAAEFYQEFQRHIDEKRIELAHGHTNADLTITYPNFI